MVKEEDSVYLTSQTPHSLLDNYHERCAKDAPNSFEDQRLASIVKSSRLPNLRSVAVPANPIDCDYEPLTNTRILNKWIKFWKERQDLQVIRDGTIRLQLLKPREVRE